MMMDFARFAGFDDDSDSGALLGRNQVVMGTRRLPGAHSPVCGLCPQRGRTQQDEAVPLVDCGCSAS